MIVLFKNNLDNKVFVLIESLSSQGGEVSIRKIAKILNMETSLRSIQLSISRLIKNNRVLKDDSWKIKLNLSGMKTKQLPLFNYDANGDIDLECMIDIWVNILLDWEEYFLLRVCDNGMDWAWIHEKDVVLIKQQNTAKHWDIIAVVIDEKMSLKTIHRDKWITDLVFMASEWKIESIITEDYIVQWVYERNLGQF